jgi:hypothetical protein
MPAADLSAASGLCSPATLSAGAAALAAATLRSPTRSPAAWGSAALLCKNRNRKQQANRDESDQLLHAASIFSVPQLFADANAGPRAPP